VELKILSCSPCVTEPHACLTLFQALPKGDKMDFIVQKATELGISVIQPVLTERCASRPDAQSMAKKCARYRKIALEAAQQSGRVHVPEVRELITREQSVCSLPEKSLLFYENGGQRLNQLIKPADTDIGIFVGSEGGFSSEEAQFL